MSMPMIFYSVQGKSFFKIPISFNFSEEEDLDLSLQQRIRSLYWTTQGFLETALDFESETVIHFYL